MEGQPIEINFLGQKVVLRSKGDPEVIQEVIRLAESKLADAKQRSSTAPAQLTALIALLEVTEEYVRSKKRFTEHRETVIQKTNEVFRLIESDMH